MSVTNDSNAVFASPPVVQVPVQEVVQVPVHENVSVGTNAADQTTVINHRQRLNPAAVVAGIAGAAILILGLVALSRADLDGTFNEPIFQVAGWDHTQLLAFIEVILGAMLLTAAGTSSLSGMRTIGAATVIAAFVALIEPNVLGGNLEIESAHAILFLVLGAATLIAAALLPTIERQSSRVSTHHAADSSNNLS